jgi:hypothetical protein
MKPYRLLLACSALAYALAGHPLVRSERGPQYARHRQP